MAKRGRKTKLTPKRLAEGIERYFASIRRTVPRTEPVETGRLDSYGHPVCEQRQVVNDLGEPVMEVQWLQPPTVEGLCLYLGISSSTWAAYCDERLHPEFADATTRARGQLRAWNLNELLTRPGKDVRGIEFNLQANYGMQARKELELGERAAKAVESRAFALDDRTDLIAELLRQSRDDGDDELIED